MHSPRSMLGTTRRIVYWKALRPDTLDLLDECARRGQPIVQERREVGAAIIRALAEPFLRHERHGLPDRAFGSVRESLVGLRERPGERQQDVVPDEREPSASGL
jgi:hypothetical protein